MAATEAAVEVEVVVVEDIAVRTMLQWAADAVGSLRLQLETGFPILFGKARFSLSTMQLRFSRHFLVFGTGSSRPNMPTA